MPRRDVRERANTERIPAGDTAARPGLRGKVAEERHRRAPDRLKVVEKVRPRALVGARLPYRDVLLEARQRTVESAREPERAKGEETLGVAQMVDHLANAPLVGRVAMQGLLVGDVAKRGEHFLSLLLEGPADVRRCRDLIDVREV